MPLTEWRLKSIWLRCNSAEETEAIIYEPFNMTNLPLDNMIRWGCLLILMPCLQRFYLMLLPSLLGQFTTIHNVIYLRIQCSSTFPICKLHKYHYFLFRKNTSMPPCYFLCWSEGLHIGQVYSLSLLEGEAVTALFATFPKLHNFLH
jgi:hypothetical protein